MNKEELDNYDNIFVKNGNQIVTGEELAYRLGHSLKTYMQENSNLSSSECVKLDSPQGPSTPTEQP